MSSRAGRKSNAFLAAIGLCAGAVLIGATVAAAAAGPAPASSSAPGASVPVSASASAALAPEAPHAIDELITTASAPLSPKEFAASRMKSEGFSPEFIQIARGAYKESKRDKLVSMSVLGFVKKADYSGHLTAKAIAECLRFMKKNRHSLELAEKIYGVDAFAVASLLWVETKHGRMLGKFPVAGTFFSLIQAEHPQVLKASLEALSEKVPSVTPEYLVQVRERSQKKAAWAMGELKSLESLHRKKLLNARKLKGSFAGAFGMPQFVPSSYEQWARAMPGNKGSPNLFHAEDAIHSVANYLKTNGWKAGTLASYRESLFHYNRSQGYVNVILQLADCVKQKVPGATPQLLLASPGEAALASQAQAESTPANATAPALAADPTRAPANSCPG